MIEEELGIIEGETTADGMFTCLLPRRRRAHERARARARAERETREEVIALSLCAAAFGKKSRVSFSTRPEKRESLPRSSVVVVGTHTTPPLVRVRSLREVECLGSCANAPMIQLNDDYYECLSPESMRSLLRQCKAGEKPPMGQWGSLPMNGQVSCEGPAGKTSLYETPGHRPTSAKGGIESRFCWYRFRIQGLVSQSLPIFASQSIGVLESSTVTARASLSSIERPRLETHLDHS